MQLRLLMPGCLLLLTAVGCNSDFKADYSQLDLVYAQGTVKLDDQPLAGAVISFDAPDGQFSYGLTDSAGKYKLQLDSDHAGVTTGEKVVRISTTRKILGLNSAEGEGEGGSGEGDDGQPKDGSGTEQVPAKYNQESELKVTVTSDKTQYDFDLSSK